MVEVVRRQFWFRRGSGVGFHEFLYMACCCVGLGVTLGLGLDCFLLFCLCFIVFLLPSTCCNKFLPKFCRHRWA